jgi:hypothetical protein
MVQPDLPQNIMYPEIIKLMDAGYEVTLRPISIDTVKISVKQAKQGTVKGVEVDLTFMEWALSEQGITDRLKEAAAELLG